MATQKEIDAALNAAYAHDFVVFHIVENDWKLREPGVMVLWRIVQRVRTELPV
jgi:hypothetical protein